MSTITAWKVSVFRVILICIFPHSDAFYAVHIKRQNLHFAQGPLKMAAKKKWTNDKTVLGVDTGCFRHWYTDFGHTNLGMPKSNL